MIDYSSVAVRIMRNMILMFPASAQHYQSDRVKQAAVKKLANAMEKRGIGEKAVARIIYWAEEYESQWMPSTGQMMAWAKEKTPIEKKNEYIEQQNQLERPQLTEQQRERNKAKFAELIKTLEVKND